MVAGHSLQRDSGTAIRKKLLRVIAGLLRVESAARGRMTLQHVDSAIAFAVVMLGASLLITVMTQAVSTLLNLRGKELRRALRDLVGTVLPNQFDQVEKLTDEILQHPLVSDSRFGSDDEKDRNQQYRLPATVAAAVIVGVAIGTGVGLAQQSVLNGVLWGVGAGAAAAAVVFLNSDRWELASALRLEEFFALLKHVGTQGANQDVAKNVSKALSAAGDIEQREQELKALTSSCRDNMKSLAATLEQRANDPSVRQLLEVILAKVGTSEERKARLTALEGLVAQDVLVAAKQLGALAEAELTLEQELEALPEKLAEAAASKLKELEVLFNAAMDRASTRFTMHSRFWTILCSFGLAFAMHLDAIELFKRVSSDAELRAKLVGSSDAMMKQADKILAAPASSVAAPASSVAAPASSVAAPASSAAAVAAAQAAKDLAECLKKGGFKTRVPGIYSAAMYCPTRVAGVADGETPGPFPTREDALDYLEKHHADKKDEARKNYGENLSKLLDGAELSQLFDHAASINAELSRSGVELWPSPYPGWPTWKEIPGLIAAAVFLSLGAPFWFNMLKTLTNLRPLVATREEKDRLDKKVKAAA